MQIAPADVSARELRADLADVINAVRTRDQATFVTGDSRTATFCWG
jgi:hypothetical protein